jgi:DNA uptake protein ComE-like DNA-binding protein
MRCGLIAALVLLAAGALPASASTAAAPAGNPHGTQAKPVQTPPLDLNSASKAQLMKLPWIGDAEAKRIIAARPYFSKTDIVTRAGIPIGVYQAIRHQIAVVPKTMPNPRG